MPDVGAELCFGSHCLQGRQEGTKHDTRVSCEVICFQWTCLLQFTKAVSSLKKNKQIELTDTEQEILLQLCLHVRLQEMSHILTKS